MISDDIVLCEPQRLNYSSLLIVFDGLARWDHWCIITVDTVSSMIRSFRRDHRSIIAHCHLTKAYQEYPRILEMLPGKLCRKPPIFGELWAVARLMTRHGDVAQSRGIDLYFFLVNRPHHRNTDIFNSINSMFICCNPYHWLGSLSNSHYVTMLSRIPSAEAVCSSTEVGSQGRWLGRSIGILWAQNSKVGEVVGMQVLLFEA